ncbi:unnamed protein product [Camellia sinensis]
MQHLNPRGVFLKKMMMHRGNMNPPPLFDDEEKMRVGLQLVMEFDPPDPFFYPFCQTPPPSISSLSPLPPSSFSSSKLAYMCLTDWVQYHWYAFQVSDDDDNQQFLHNNPRLPFHKDGYDLDSDSEQFLKPVLTANLYTVDGTSWVIHNTSLYQFVIHRKDCKREYQLVRIDLGNNPMAKKLEILPQLPHALAPDVHTLVLAGKFYCLGSLEPPPSPWALAFDPTLNQWESLPNPCPTPPFPYGIYSIFSVAIQVPKPCILVGWPKESVLRRYDVDNKIWVSEEFEIPKTRFFGPDDLMGHALAVDSKLYWYSALHTRSRLIGYDLAKKIWFMGKLKLHDYGQFYVPEDTGPPPPPSFAHLGGEKFCLFWFSVVHPKPTTLTDEEEESSGEEEVKVEVVPRPLNEDSLRIHCLKFRVNDGSRPPKSGIFPLEISSISCQSYLVAEYSTYFCNGLVV